MSAAPPLPNPTSRWLGWRNALAITLLGCLLIGVGGFVVLGTVLPQRFSLWTAAILQQIGFATGLAVIFAVIVGWQRSRGETLAELGWRRPTRPGAIIAAVLLGVLYLGGSYFGVRELVPNADPLAFHWARVALAPLGIGMAIAEETMMRGFFMTELQRARIATSVQIVASGACSAIYHALHERTLLGFLPAFVLFSLHAALYVYGRRSLTPSIIAHSIYHVFGQPYLLMMVLTIVNR
ncbi:MAG TPA: type II CAAX endopeptidase family protein [Planctomycetaceae bacterium]|nr:type II CAAX endopeptidase family protein [Planctomycetaceae bacterium]